MGAAGKEASSRLSEGYSEQFIDIRVSRREMTEMDDALRSCTEQLLLIREENESLIIEAANKISSEQKKSRDLLQKLEAANKRFAKVATENYNLQNTLNSKDKLIRELKESNAHSEQGLTEATAKLEYMQKQSASLQYEVCMVQKELEIRNKEREYDLQSIDAAQKQQQESLQKITALEAECQRLRTMVQKRLPGPAALVKMKDEVERRGTSSVENGTRRARTSTAVQPSLRGLSRRHSVSEGYLVKLQEMDDENRHLRQLLARKESEIQYVQLQYADEASKLSVAQTQLKELWSDHDLEENNSSDQFSSRLLSKPEQLGTGKKQTSQSQSRRFAETDIQLLVDLAEIEKLEMASTLSSSPHQYGTDASYTHSKRVLSEIVHRDQISEDGFLDKYPELIQDVLKLIIHKHRANKISVNVILDEVTRALRSEISTKEDDATGFSYHPEEIHSMVATLIERISCMIERSTGNSVTSCQLFLHGKTELTSQLEHLVHVCSDVLDGNANLQKLINDVCLTLEWVVSQCFFCVGGPHNVDSFTNISNGNESVRAVNTQEKQAIHSTKSEMDSGMRQEVQKELSGIIEGQIPVDVPETHSQIQFATCKIDEELLARQEQNDNCQESQSVYLEAESAAAADGSMEDIPEVEGKQPTTNLAISAAAEKLAECQETMTNLSKQLQALQTPGNVGASGRKKPDALPLSVPKVLAEEDAKPDDFSSPSSEEVAQKKQQGGPAAAEKDLVHEQGAETGHRAGNIGLRQAFAPPVIPRSPRPSFSADVKKKRRRGSLLSRLVFRRNA